jgi:hypothetical protein
MAKPIRSTPELTGEEADKFLEKMITVEQSKITVKQRSFAKEIERNMSQLVVC